MNYTLVLYKSDGCNTCRGCVMESWGSDFSLDVDVEESDAIERIASAFTAPSEGGGYTAHLIGLIEERNDPYDKGMLTPAQQVVYEFIQHSRQYSYNPYQPLPGYGMVKSSHYHDAIVEFTESECVRINNLIRTKVKETLENKKLEEEKATQLKKEQEAKAKENYERQQLEALKNKYEGTK